MQAVRLPVGEYVSAGSSSALLYLIALMEQHPVLLDARDDDGAESHEDVVIRNRSSQSVEYDRMGEEVCSVAKGAFDDVVLIVFEANDLLLKALGHEFGQHGCAHVIPAACLCPQFLYVHLQVRRQLAPQIHSARAAY